MYVKEHAPKSHSASSSSSCSDDQGDSTAATRTLFIANCPANGPIPTDAYLRAIFESSFIADIARVSVVRTDPRGRTAITAATATPNYMFFRQTTVDHLDDDNDISYTRHSRRRKGDGKFAHVVFATSREMKRVMKKLVLLVNREQPPLRLENDVLHQLSVVQTQDNENYDTNEEQNYKGGIHAIVARAHYKAGRHMSRQELMQRCNDVMTSYEHEEEEMIKSAKSAKDQPDKDGFVTVTHNKKKAYTSSSMTMMTATSSIELEEYGGIGGGGRQRGGGIGGASSKRNRKRKNANELTDFYRYQMKQSRKGEVQDLKKRFEEDLVRVQKMKEERAYRPF